MKTKYSILMCIHTGSLTIILSYYKLILIVEYKKKLTNWITVPPCSVIHRKNTPKNILMTQLDSSGFKGNTLLSWNVIIQVVEIDQNQFVIRCKLTKSKGKLYDSLMILMRISRRCDSSRNCSF